MPEFTPPTDSILRAGGSYSFQAFTDLFKEPVCIHNGCTGDVRHSKSLVLPGRKGQRGIMTIFHCPDHGGEAKAFVTNVAKLFASQVDGNLGATLSQN